MTYDARHLRKDEKEGGDMEREEERTEHMSGMSRLSEEARAARNAGRQLANADEDMRDGDYKQLVKAVTKLQESVEAQKGDINQAVKRMSQMLYEMRGLVDGIERIYSDAKDDEHAVQQAALNGVNKAQEKAEEITLRNIDEATQRSKKAIDTMVLESKRRIERLAMVTLPDRLFHFLKWTALMLALFIMVHIVWQMFW